MSKSIKTTTTNRTTTTTTTTNDPITKQEKDIIEFLVKPFNIYLDKSYISREIIDEYLYKSYELYNFSNTQLYKTLLLMNENTSRQHIDTLRQNINDNKLGVPDEKYNTEQNIINYMTKIHNIIIPVNSKTIEIIKKFLLTVEDQAVIGFNKLKFIQKVFNLNISSLGAYINVSQINGIQKQIDRIVEKSNDSRKKKSHTPGATSALVTYYTYEDYNYDDENDLSYLEEKYQSNKRDAANINNYEKAKNFLNNLAVKLFSTLIANNKYNIAYDKTNMKSLMLYILVTISYFQKDVLKRYLEQMKINYEIFQLCIKFLRNTSRDTEEDYGCWVIYSKPSIVRKDFQIEEQQPLYKFCDTNDKNNLERLNKGLLPDYMNLKIKSKNPNERYVQVACFDEQEIIVDYEKVFFAKIGFYGHHDQQPKQVDALLFNEPSMKRYFNINDKVIEGIIYVVEYINGYLFLYQPYRYLTNVNQQLEYIHKFCCLDFNHILNNVTSVEKPRYFVIPNCITNKNSNSSFSSKYTNIDQKLNNVPSLKPLFSNDEYNDNGFHRPFTAYKEKFSVNTASNLKLDTNKVNENDDYNDSNMPIQKFRGNWEDEIDDNNEDDIMGINSPFLYAFLDKKDCLILHMGVYA